jgi:hypothetical protein
VKNPFATGRQIFSVNFDLSVMNLTMMIGTDYNCVEIRVFSTILASNYSMTFKAGVVFYVTKIAFLGVVFGGLFIDEFLRHDIYDIDHILKMPYNLFGG